MATASGMFDMPWGSTYRRSDPNYLKQASFILVYTTNEYIESLDYNNLLAKDIEKLCRARLG